MLPRANHRLIDSIIWRVLLPITFVVLLWPIYKYLVGLEHSFQLTFSHGELLICSAILLMEVIIELNYIDSKTTMLYTSKSVALFFVILFIFAFGFLKYQAITAEHDMIKFEIVKTDMIQDEQGATLTLNKLTGFSCLNCSVAIISVIFGVCNFVAIRNKQMTTTLREATGVESDAAEI
jgi:hypothetical protein